MLKQILDNFKELRQVEKAIKEDISKLRRLKTMIEIEKKNCTKRSIENKIIDLKKKYIEELKEKWLTEIIEELDDKQYKLMIKNTKDFGGNDYIYLDIEEVK